METYDEFCKRKYLASKYFDTYIKYCNLYNLKPDRKMAKNMSIPALTAGELDEITSKDVFSFLLEIHVAHDTVFKDGNPEYNIGSKYIDLILKLGLKEYFKLCVSGRTKQLAKIAVKKHLDKINHTVASDILKINDLKLTRYEFAHLAYSSVDVKHIAKANVSCLRKIVAKTTVKDSYINTIVYDCTNDKGLKKLCMERMEEKSLISKYLDYGQTDVLKYLKDETNIAYIKNRLTLNDFSSIKRRCNGWTRCNTYFKHSKDTSLELINHSKSYLAFGLRGIIIRYSCYINLDFHKFKKLKHFGLLELEDIANLELVSVRKHELFGIVIYKVKAIKWGGETPTIKTLQIIETKHGRTYLKKGETYKDAKKRINKKYKEEQERIAKENKKKEEILKNGDKILTIEDLVHVGACMDGIESFIEQHDLDRDGITITKALELIEFDPQGFINMAIERKVFA